MKVRTLLLLFTAFLFLSPLMAGPDVGIDKPAPNFTLKNIDGEKVSLSDYEGKYVVLEWVNFGCPFVKKHYGSGNIPKLQRDYMAKEVVWLTICSSAEGKQGNYPADKIRKKLVGYSASPSEYLLDESGEVGKTYGAKTTPHMYIINPEGDLIYMGGIDSIASTNVDDLKKAKNYVAAALDAAMADKEIENQVTKFYGCSVKY